MNISKINSTPAFRGYITVTDENNRVRTFDSNHISEIKKYKNGTVIDGIIGNDRVECFVSNKKASFQDIAAAYNMTKSGVLKMDNVDLASSNIDLKV